MFEALYLPRPLVNHFHIQVCWSLWSKDHVALFKSHVHRKMSQAQGSEDECPGIPGPEIPVIGEDASTGNPGNLESRWKR